MFKTRLLSGIVLVLIELVTLYFSSCAVFAQATPHCDHRHDQNSGSRGSQRGYYSAKVRA